MFEQKLNDESIMKSQLDMKTPQHSVSGRSYLASTPDSSNVAVFEVRPHYDRFDTFIIIKPISVAVFESIFIKTVMFCVHHRVTGFG